MIHIKIPSTNKFYRTETMREAVIAWYCETNNIASLPDNVIDNDEYFYSLIAGCIERTYDTRVKINPNVPTENKILAKDCSIVFWLEEQGELEINYGKTMLALDPDEEF